MAKRPKIGGRQKGTPNKVTRTAREMFTRAAEGVGGLEALIAWARAEPDKFWLLYARLIPVEHTGTEGGPIATTVQHIYETLTPKA